jgi:O-glycosyl hydrolase
LIQINKGAVMPAKRLYVLGQYSRFIRPGWVRVGTDEEPAKGLYVSAYRSGDKARFAVVMVNESEEGRAVTLAVEGSGASTYEVYRTSEAEDLEQVSSGKKVGKIYIAPRSVTTLYAY